MNGALDHREVMSEQNIKVYSTNVSGVICCEIKSSCRVAVAVAVDFKNGCRDQGLNYTLSHVRQDIMCNLKLLAQNCSGRMRNQGQAG